MSKSKNAFRALSLLDDESAESIAGKQSKRAQRRVHKAAEHRSGRPRNLPSSYGSSQCDAGQIYCEPAASPPASCREHGDAAPTRAPLAAASLPATAIISVEEARLPVHGACQPAATAFSATVVATPHGSALQAVLLQQPIPSRASPPQPLWYEEPPQPPTQEEFPGLPAPPSRQGHAPLVNMWKAQRPIAQRQVTTPPG